MSNKIRATINEIGGRKKYEIIKYVISRYNKSIEENYFLEAIALIESLICDRLESRLGELSKKNVKLDTLGGVLKKLKVFENDSELLKLMLEIEEWSKFRNIAIHESAKIELGDEKNFKQFLNQANATALKGKNIFNKLNKRIKKIRSKRFTQ